MEGFLKKDYSDNRRLCHSSDLRIYSSPMPSCALVLLLCASALPAPLSLQCSVSSVVSCRSGDTEGALPKSPRHCEHQSGHCLSVDSLVVVGSQVVQRTLGTSVSYKMQL